MSSSRDKKPDEEGRRRRRSSQNSPEESEPSTSKSYRRRFFSFGSSEGSKLTMEGSEKHRRSVSSHTSSTDSQPSTPAPTSPTKQFFNFLKSPKSFLSKKSQIFDKAASSKSCMRPILSSQCSEKRFEFEISPILPASDVHVIWYDADLESTVDSRFDFGSLDEEKIIPSFFSSRTCYDAMPKSGKVIVLSTELLVKNAFSCLVTNEIRAAPLWESSSMTFIGLLTISDFINVLRHYYYTSQDDIKDIENQQIVTWRRITKVSRPIIKISPNDSLVKATKLLIEERIHRLPVYDEKRNSVLFVLTRKRLLQYLYNNLIEKFGRTNLKIPPAWRKTIGELKSQIGTWENIATVSVNTRVIEALDLFCERQVSALPVMDEENKIVDIFAKFDVFALAKEQTYDNLDMTVAEALDKAEVHEDVYGCTMDEPLGTVIERFANLKARRLVVIGEKQAVIGILSLSDILKFLILQSLDDGTVASDTIDEVPEGAIGGQDDSSVFISSGKESSRSIQKTSSLEKQDSSDLSEDIGKLQLEGDTTEPLSEASACEEDP